MTQHSADLALAADQRRRAYVEPAPFLCVQCDAERVTETAFCHDCGEVTGSYVHRLPDWGFYNMPVAKGIGIDGGDL